MCVISIFRKKFRLFQTKMFFSFFFSIVPVPCDTENNCHENASCEWDEAELRNKCVCKPGFDGNGYQCIEREISCLFVSISIETKIQ